MSMVIKTFYRGTGANNNFAIASGEVGVVFGAKGNDTITGNLGDDVFYGGAGNDSISGGDGNDVIFGDIGNDTIVGGNGDDSMLGGAGNDVFKFGDNSGYDVTDGDAGVDIMDFGDITGSTGVTIVVGTTNFNVFVGMGSTGNDLGQAYDIEKVIGSDTDNDTLDGGVDSDGFTVDLSKALQTVSGLLALKNLEGFENVTGGTGNDTMTGNASANVMNGGDGNDLINASLGQDTYDGGEGDDTLTFASKAFTSTSAMKFDLSDGTINYGETSLSVANFEYIVGAKGKADVLDASGLEEDTLGYTGIKVDLSTAKGTFSLNADPENINEDFHVNDTFDALKGVIGFEIVYGSQSEDSITGDKGNNTIWGNLGDDYLSGGAGNDYFDERYVEDEENDENSILAGLGDDTIDGGAGNDTVYYGNLLYENFDINIDEEDGIYLYNGYDEDLLIGIENIVINGDPEEGNDEFDFSDLSTGLTFNLATGKLSGLPKTSKNMITSLSGVENVEAGDGNDKITVGDKSNAAVDNELEGGGGNDTLDGGFGDDDLYGNAGNDSLIGGEGDDRLYAGDGNNVLDGGKGEDTLYGDVGNDKMLGGADNDKYYNLSAFGEPAAFGTDTISDSAGTEDSLGLTSFTYDAETVAFTIVDGSTDKDTNKLDALKITIGEYGVIIIDNYFNNSLTTLSGLEASDMVKGTGCIEYITMAYDESNTAYFTFDVIKDLLTGGEYTLPE